MLKTLKYVLKFTWLSMGIGRPAQHTSRAYDMFLQ